MRCFGLTPEQVLSREPSPRADRFPSLAYSMIYGALSFGVVSVVAYTIWGFRLIRGAAGMYSATALIYIVLAGLALSHLVRGTGTAPRFAVLFGIAFLAYAVAWCAFWFGLGGKYYADFWGSVAGLAILTWLVRRAFGQRDRLLLCFVTVLALHSAGYYLGVYLYGNVRGSTGRLLFGAGHGLGFGAAMGFLLFHAQAALKARLANARPATESASARSPAP